MPIIFNTSDSDSLVLTINQEVRKAALIGKQWIFYAITCYFNPETIIELITNIANELGDQLSQICILVDLNQLLKNNVTSNELIERISYEIKININYIRIIPIFCKNHLFHAKSYALISEKFFFNDDEYQGFVSVTSAIFSENGLRKNIEIGHIMYDFESLLNFSGLVDELCEDYAVSAEQETKNTEFKSAIKFFLEEVFTICGILHLI